MNQRRSSAWNSIQLTVTWPSLWWVADVGLFLKKYCDLFTFKICKNGWRTIFKSPVLTFWSGPDYSVDRHSIGDQNEEGKWKQIEKTKKGLNLVFFFLKCLHYSNPQPHCCDNVHLPTVVWWLHGWSATHKATVIKLLIASTRYAVWFFLHIENLALSKL